MLIRSLLPSSSFKPHCMYLSFKLSSRYFEKNMSCFKISIFINFSCKSRTTASTIYENANFETTHSLFKIPVDLDDDNEDENHLINGSLLNESSGAVVPTISSTNYNNIVNQYHQHVHVPAQIQVQIQVQVPH